MLRRVQILHLDLDLAMAAARTGMRMRAAELLRKLYHEKPPLSTMIMPKTGDVGSRDEVDDGSRTSRRGRLGGLSARSGIDSGVSMRVFFLS